MAYLNPEEAWQDFRDRALEAARTNFPIKGRTMTLSLENIDVNDNLSSNDIKSQHEAKVNGKTWAVPVYATLSLKNNESGKTMDTKRVRLFELPKPTPRYSYIVDGQEYQVDNQWQLKPGVYARRQNNGQLQAKFNVTGHTAFDIDFDPASKRFTMVYKKAKLSLYPILKVMGVSDDDLERSWSKEILDANRAARRGAVEQFYKTSTGQPAPSAEAAKEYLFKAMEEAKVTPEVTEKTLGKSFDHITGEALHLATNKLLKVQAGTPEDDRDSLIYKNLRTLGDYAHGILTAGTTKRAIMQKTQRQLNNDKASTVRDVVKFDVFNEPLRQFFTSSGVSRTASQVNPLEMVSSAMQTTIMGPGGIKSDRSITDEAKMINASHVGFLDPINTPEGVKTGVTLRLPLGVSKIGNEARIPLYNLRTGRVDNVGPKEFAASKVVLPDQVEWREGKPVAVSSKVKYVGQGNKIEEGKMSEADYAFRHPSQLFNLTSNLIPFLGNNSGGRAGMASRHMEQAISLVHREAPLVQVSSGVARAGIDTFERVLGHQTSHRAPVDGTVKKVSKDAIVVTDKEGKDHDVQLYHYYPLNDAKSVMHSTPTVEVGQKVRRDQLLADTNFSKDGTLALGTNLRVSYVPFKGYNFEDGVVISQSAADKLSSMHLHKHTLEKLDNVVLDKKLFTIRHPGVFKAEQLDRLGDDGVVREGQHVKPGDPLIVAMRPFEIKDRTGLSAIRKHVLGHHSDNSVRWDSEFEGDVVSARRVGDRIAVHVRTVEPMQVGDKIAGRYGNKGIVTLILPNHEMPHDKDKKPIDVLLNPSGVPGRMNIGQMLETAAAKIANKTGKTYVVKNFDSHTPDYLEHVKSEIAKNGLSDTEELFDPTTKKSLGQALTGPQYMLKLMHQVEKKLSVRSGMGLPGMPTEQYDMNHQPSGGGHSGGQTIGALGMYALLAHGARANIREMQTWKSEGQDPQTNEFKRWPSQHVDVWTAIQNGTPLPTPKSTFAFQKFTDMLRGAGINVEKKGHNIVLSPLTDKDILRMSGGELTAAGRLVRAKTDKSGEFKPLPGGLFDEKVTGGHGGTKWAHIKLAEPIPNPVFEKAIKSITGLTQTGFNSIVSGEKGVSRTSHKLVGAKDGITGGAGIKFLLSQVKVDDALKKAKNDLNVAAGTKAKLDPALKRVKYLQALKHLELKPEDAYILHNLPVVPPVIRPLTIMQDGNVKYEDLNGLYAQFAQVNDKLKDPILRDNLTDKKKESLRDAYYDGVKALVGVTALNRERKERGLLQQIQGTQPKEGYFQKTLVNRRQDLTMRSTIVPEPALGLDEVGIPREAALTLFRPFVIRQLVQQGTAPNAPEAQVTLAAVHKGKDDPSVWRALQQVMNERPVLLKRDPALHKYSVQAFNAKLVHGNAIQIHPLVTGGFNADFDGDTMALYVPISHEAVSEARKMYPSNNIFNEVSGRVMYQPTLESALGLYKLSIVGDKTNHNFATKEAVAQALQAGTVKYSDRVKLSGKETTPGRVLLAAVLPESMQNNILHDLSFIVNKKGLDTVLTELGKTHRHEFGRVVNEVKDLGNGASYGIIKTPLVKDTIAVGTHTLSLDDVTTDKVTRDRILREAQKQVDSVQEKNIKPMEKERQSVEIWNKASEKMKDEHTKASEKNPSNLFMMQAAGVKPSWDQYKQMVLAPMLVKDSADRIIPTPVMKSYAEGVDLAGYWTQLHGARRGAVLKVQEVQEPGAISKLLMNTSMNLLVEGSDCGTHHGITLPINESDVHDRYLAKDFSAGHLHLKKDTLLTTDLVAQIRNADKNAKVVVRTPLKCEMSKGLCQKCVGLSVNGHDHELGTNIGVLSAQAVGERAVQLTLKSFHTGGVQEAGGGSKILNQFARFEQLTKLPRTIPNAATIAMTSGKIEKIEDDPTGVKIWINGRAHHVGKDANGLALHKDVPLVDREANGYVKWERPELGMHIEAGQPLSDLNRTYINPHDLYQATGNMDKVQNHLASSIFELYKDEGLRRRTVETIVKAMGNLTKVQDPGDHPYVLRGEFYPTSVIRKINDTELKGKQPILHKPVLQGIDMLPLSLHEDWMAKLQHQRLRQTIADAASLGLASHIHGAHPIPGIAYGAEFGKPAPSMPAHHY